MIFYKANIKTKILINIIFYFFCFNAIADVKQKDELVRPAIVIGNGHTGPILRRLEGPYLSICAQDTKICKRVKMPKALGRVEEIFPGPFLEHAHASWVALSKDESFLCTVPEDTQKVVCVRVNADRFPTEHARLQVGIKRDGTAATFSLARSTSVDSAKLKIISSKFNRAVERSAQILQGESDGLAMRSFDFAATTSVCDEKDPGPPPGPGCVRQGDDWVCPEIDVHGDPWPWPDIPFPVPFPDFPGDEPPPTDVPLCG